MINARKVESRPKCLGACALCAAVDGIVKFKWGGNVVTDLHNCVSTYSSRTRHTPPPAGVPQEKPRVAVCLLQLGIRYVIVCLSISRTMFHPLLNFSVDAAMRL